MTILFLLAEIIYTLCRIPLTFFQIMMAKKKPTVCVTMASSADVIGMAHIDSECFGKEAMPRRWFSRQLLTEDTLTFAYIAKCTLNQKPVGYLIAEYQGDRVVVNRVAVLPMYRRQGHGTHLVNMLMVDKPSEVHTFHTMVPESALDTQLFFKGNGWNCVGIKPMGFTKRGEDGYKFEFLPGKV